VTEAEREKAFYDRQYQPLLLAPEHAQRVDLQTMRSNCEDPRHPFFERRRLYAATLEALMEIPLAGLRVLDYGCGPADFGVWMATEGAEVTLLDISQTAVDLGILRAAASGVGGRVRGIAADASHLPQLADASYDLVFACASLHHTMKYEGAVGELARVVRPGGRLVLCETWGENPLLALARRVRAWTAGEEEDQGEEIVLSRRELRRLEPWFEGWRIETFHFLTMAKRLLRGRLHTRGARVALSLLENADRAMIGAVPPLRWWCGEALIIARRSNHAVANNPSDVKPA
jgi:2-polyprenyl-3-methyl-5-hydroxy-6-metoxy-1,4-benzoquinol methylase